VISRKNACAVFEALFGEFPTSGSQKRQDEEGNCPGGQGRVVARTIRKDLCAAIGPREIEPLGLESRGRPLRADWAIRRTWPGFVERLMRISGRSAKMGVRLSAPSEIGEL